MAKRKAGKARGGGTHSRTPRKRTQTTVRPGGMLSPTIPRRLAREAARLRRDMREVAGTTTAACPDHTAGLVTVDTASILRSGLESESAFYRYMRTGR